jgi:para-nitrobenzyl esterase
MQQEANMRPHTGSVLAGLALAAAVLAQASAKHTIDDPPELWRNHGAPPVPAPETQSAERAVAPAAAGPALAGTGPAVETVDVFVPQLGVARGIRGPAVTKFLGLPYAEPPVGPLRWRPPQPVTSWEAGATNGTQRLKADASARGGAPLDATVFGPACLASMEGGGSWLRKEEQHSEDCLYLSVTLPSAHLPAFRAGRAAPLPVVVWIHGGGFVLGSSSNPSVSPPPDNLVQHGDVIFVSVNYR